jgi:ribosome-associated translation inhibitor RaiA
MDITIRAHRVLMTTETRDRICKRLHHALGRVAARLGRIEVQCLDDNGPRGGTDQRCRIRVALPGPDVVVEDRADRLHTAIDRAADRAGRAVMRVLERRRGHRASRLLPA